MTDRRSNVGSDLKSIEIPTQRKRLADYFVIIGLDSFGHELELETGGE